MEVTVDVAGGERTTVEVDGDTYGAVIEAVGLSQNEAAVLVDGRPVPEDRPIDVAHVTVLRLIHGG